ncbi:MarR family winged helix-turn-helix transcriptional regulator [Mycolicibacterium canariasense]|uniref:MarR family winged helix-turn-helix transcriptional regulator n=1 Tax=Mycolicibacterium canariasense TaxID=228230 RepID=UPI000B24271B|nr:MarR family transcriptional regulator [Mycolicibacterium canariasense]MCV7212834.1 MarR family transcriptional regulator [Mycolicibacterium canariasense]
MTSKVARQLTENVGVSQADYSILVRLSEAGGAIPRQALETRLSWSASRLSHQLTRMEARGLLRRADAGFGRNVDVTLTDAGSALFKAAEAVHGDAVRTDFLGTLPDAVVDFLHRVGAADQLHTET